MSDANNGSKGFSIYDLHRAQKAARPAVEFLKALCQSPEHEIVIYGIESYVDRFMKLISTNVIVSAQVPRGYVPGTVHVTARHRIIAKTDFSGSFNTHLLW